MLTSLAQQLPQLYTPLITKAKAASKALQFAAEWDSTELFLKEIVKSLLRLSKKMVFFCALIVYLLKMFILMLDILMNYITLIGAA